MQYISFPNATYLYLGISDNSSSTLAHRTTFRSIYSALPVSLRRLEIKIVSHQSERSAEVPLGPNAINFDDFVQPLQFLRNLRELILCARLYNHTPEFLELLNGDLMSLIPSWPELVLFEYNVEHHSHYTYHTQPHDRPTLDTIFAFARTHPHLLHLRLPDIDTDRLPHRLDSSPSQEDAPFPLEGHGLMWFRVDRPIDDSTQNGTLEPFALAIDRAFPQVYKELRRSHAPDRHPQWRLLEKELFALHAEEEPKGG